MPYSRPTKDGGRTPYQWRDYPRGWNAVQPNHPPPFVVRRAAEAALRGGNFSSNDGPIGKYLQRAITANLRAKADIERSYRSSYQTIETEELKELDPRHPHLLLWLDSQEVNRNRLTAAKVQFADKSVQQRKVKFKNGSVKQIYCQRGGPVRDVITGNIIPKPRRGRKPSNGSSPVPGKERVAKHRRRRKILKSLGRLSSQLRQAIEIIQKARAQ